VIAHGMLGMALLGRFLTEKFSAAPLSQFSARFTGIIKIDQALLCRARLAARGRSSVTLELEALDAAGKLVISGSAVLATGA
jgi:acyl-CoA thioesterase FadM